jgi:hypothetical protein
VALSLVLLVDGLVGNEHCLNLGISTYMTTIRWKHCLNLGISNCDYHPSDGSKALNL